MTVFVLEKVPQSSRGELTRWLLEVSTGVFIGTVSALVRDLLWKKVCEQSKGGRCILAHRTNNEQGFSIRMHGDSKRSVLDVEGLTLIANKNAAWEAYMQDLEARESRKPQPVLENAERGE